MKIALIILILQGLLSCDFLNKSKSNSSSSSSSKPIFLSATRSWEVGSQHCLIDNGKTYCWGPGHANGFNTTGNELIPTLIPNI